MSTRMTAQEREAFLLAPRVAIISVADGDRGPLTVPVWYSYTPGSVIRFVTGRHSLKSRLISQEGRIGFCVQTETPPYQYVSVEGPAHMEEVEYDEDVRAMAVRYLGERGAERYLAGTTPEQAVQDSVAIVVRPERWRTVDYTKLEV